MPIRWRAVLPLAALLVVPVALTAQRPTQPPSDTGRRDDTRRIPDAPAPWYERLAWRGYAQFRYNRLLETNPNLGCAQCDRSIGNNGGFFLRRGRLILFGNVHPRVYVYVQPDYGSDAAGAQHYLQIRDAYFDLYLTKSRAHRLRFGQSKVPYGFENLQSSQNRLPLDRHDGLNSAVANERDIGVLYYWSPPAAASRFRSLIEQGLKGSGDYGVFGFGLYNGQTANRPEANNSSHAVARLTYPWRLPNGQFVETSIQGFTGRVVPPVRSAGVTSVHEYRDERAAVSLVWYAQPLGVVAEYTRGRGPQYVAATNSIETRPLEGGMAQVMYRWQVDGHTIQPFARAHRYRGGKKVEQDARRYDVADLDLGVEWLPVPNFELTVQYSTSDRFFEDAMTVGNRQKGQLLRLQAQFNY